MAHITWEMEHPQEGQAGWLPKDQNKDILLIPMEQSVFPGASLQSWEIT